MIDLTPTIWVEINKKTQITVCDDAGNLSSIEVYNI
jgi:hypothetical protein